MKVQPRFKPRAFLRLNYKNFNQYFSKELFIEDFLKKNTKKNKILNYSQLRIATLHFLFNEIPSNSNVATSCYTIYDMVNVIINAGHNPVFVDINKKNLCPDVNQLINLVEEKKVQAVIFTHLHGYNVSLLKLKKICKKNNCILIEDCAQSLWDKEWTKNTNIPGSYGDVALFSTGFFKAINSISGGYLLFNGDENKFDKLCNSYSSLKGSITFDFVYRFIYGLCFFCLTNRFTFSIFLFPILKYSKKNKIEFVNKRAREENNPKLIKRSKKSILKMNFFQRIFLRFQDLNKLNKDYRKRIIIAEFYIEKLHQLIKNEILYIPGISSLDDKYSMNYFSVYYQIPVLCKDSEELINYLVNHNIDIARQHIKNLTNYQPYKSYTTEKYKIAEETSRKLILLPCYPNLKLKYIEKITNSIKNFYLKNNVN